MPGNTAFRGSAVIRRRLARRHQTSSNFEETDSSNSDSDSSLVSHLSFNNSSLSSSPASPVSPLTAGIFNNDSDSSSGQIFVGEIDNESNNDNNSSDNDDIDNSNSPGSIPSILSNDSDNVIGSPAPSINDESHSDNSVVSESGHSSIIFGSERGSDLSLYSDSETGSRGSFGRRATAAAVGNISQISSAGSSNSDNFLDFSENFSERFDSAGNSPPTAFSSSSSTGNQPIVSATSLTSSGMASGGGGRGTMSFECNVCLENLDAPASIDVEDPLAGAGSLASGVGGSPDNILGDRNSSPRGRGRGGRGRGNAGRRTVRNNDENASLTDVVATFCGHLYHQVCLFKWFRQQGRRTCPSCRKTILLTKLVRLYPGGSSVDLGRGSPAATATAPAPNANSNGNVSGGSGLGVVADPGQPGSNSDEQSPNGCTNPDCVDLRDCHNTLKSDYDHLNERYLDEREQGEVLQAQVNSLVEDNTRKEEEIEQLKRQLEERSETTPSTSIGNKRRRH